MGMPKRKNPLRKDLIENSALACMPEMFCDRAIQTQVLLK
jgi:hypothetical protein